MNRFLLSMFASLVALAGCQRGILVSDLRCEHASEPIGVDTRRPFFSWRVEGDESFVQSSFSIIVENADSCVWQSPLVESDAPYYLPSEDLNLSSREDYVWTVEVNGEDGTSARAVSSFSTAFLSTEDWKAAWITDAYDKDFEPAPVLRKEFKAAPGLVSARLYISAAAYAYMRINGKPVSSSPLLPGFTDYRDRNLYCCYDVTDLVKSGSNVMLAVLGNGFYNEIDHVAVWEMETAPWRGRARMSCELDLRYEDGTGEEIMTDSSWKALADQSFNPYLINNLYSGDHFDCRKVDASMALPGYDDSSWQQASVVSSPSPLMKAEIMPHIEVCETLEPEAVTLFSDSLVVIDFGKNISGVHRFRLKGESGAVLKVLHGELLDDSGRVTVSNMDEHFRPKPLHEFQTDVYYLSGNDDELTNTFNYHGFRYVELRSDRPFTVKEAYADFVHTDLPPTGSFKCSDKTLNDLHGIIVRSYLSNAHSIPTDCPQREKNGWLETSYMCAPLGFLNFDPINFYLKWADDIVDNQDEEGKLTDIVPSPGWGLYIGGPIWESVLYMLPEIVLNYSGDKRIVEKLVDAGERYLAWLGGFEREDGTIDRGLGDWVAWKTITPVDYLVTCYYYKDNLLQAQFENMLGRDGSAYAAKAESLKAVINDRYFDPETDTYSIGSQTAQAIALYYDIVPEGHAAGVAERLSRVVADNDDFLDFGSVGSRTVVRMLTRYGYVDQAFRMITKKEAPSWANWLECGYTTAIEVWKMDGRYGASLNHPFIGADLDAWFFNDVAGLNADPEKPGFQHTIVRPHFIESLDWAKASVVGICGEVKSSWRRRGSKVILDVTVPVGGTATVIADGKTEEVGAGKHRFVFHPATNQAQIHL